MQSLTFIFYSTDCGCFCYIIANPLNMNERPTVSGQLQLELMKLNYHMQIHFDK